MKSIGSICDLARCHTKFTSSRVATALHLLRCSMTCCSEWRLSKVRKSSYTLHGSEFAPGVLIISIRLAQCLLGEAGLNIFSSYATVLFIFSLCCRCWPLNSRFICEFLSAIIVPKKKRSKTLHSPQFSI